MGIINRMRRQTAVYWGKVGNTDTGRPQYTEPVELRVRWDDVVEEGTSNAKVYLPQDVVLGGLLFLGALDSLSARQQQCPWEVPGAYEIKRFEKMPNMRASEFLRIATL